MIIKLPWSIWRDYKNDLRKATLVPVGVTDNAVVILTTKRWYPIVMFWYNLRNAIQIRRDERVIILHWYPYTIMLSAKRKPLYVRWN